MSSTAAAGTRPYQGYPYTSPMVFDAPSIDPTAEDKWRHLPRRPVDLPLGRLNVGNVSTPGEGGSQTGETNGSLTPDFLADTILYDPFEDRRINVQRPTPSEPDTQSSSNNQSAASSPREPPRTNISSPTGSSSSNAPGPSSSANSQDTRERHLPPMLSKEAYVYSPRTPQEDGFRLSPLPVSEFREPPPAYTEIDRAVITAQPTAAAPPRTEVVIQNPAPAAASGVLDQDRKFLVCQHCGNRVHTLVIRESGAATHILAWSCMLLCMFPITAMVYCTNACKYKNHYCPSCNRLVGYEVPMLCQPLVKVT